MHITMFTMIVLYLVRHSKVRIRVNLGLMRSHDRPDQYCTHLSNSAHSHSQQKWWKKH